MRTTISNKIYIYNTTKEVYFWCRDNLVVQNPLYSTLMRLGKQDQIRIKHIPENMNLYVEKNISLSSQGFGDLVLPYGVIYAIWPMIKNYPVETKFNETSHISVANDTPTYPLFDYQEEAVEHMLKAGSGILIGGTGSGKTNCGIEICRRTGKRFLWLTHTKDLVKQSYERFKSLYPNIQIGTVGDGKLEFGQDGTIATIQTMVTLDPDLYKDDFDLVICDECHHVAGSPELQKMFVKVVEKIAAKHKYGLTASKNRNDSLGKTMYATIGCNRKGEFAPVWEIKKSDTKTLTAEHIKVELPTPFSYECLNTDGTFNYGGLVDYLANNEERNKAILDKIVEVATDPERKQLILCTRKAQCELLHQELLNRGIVSELLIGKVSSKKREAILKEKVNWQVIVATVSLAKEGLDLPNLNVLHLASCIGNESDTIQSVGRVERFKENKPQPWVFDYVDVNIPYLVSRYKKRVNWLRKRG